MLCTGRNDFIVKLCTFHSKSLQMFYPSLPVKFIYFKFNLDMTFCFSITSFTDALAGESHVKKSLWAPTVSVTSLIIFGHLSLNYKSKLHEK